MRKIIFLCMAFALLSSTVVKAQTQANIFASELKASAVTTANEVTFSYTLNADATAVTITVSNGDEFVLTGADLTKGKHSVTKTLKPGAGDYSWSVKAVGAPNTAVTPVATTSATFVAPRGLAMDKNFDSPFFGHIYVADNKGSATNGGIYAFDATLSDFSGQGATAYASDWAASTASPLRVTVAQDGRVYISDWSDYATSGVYIWDPANPTAPKVPIFGGTMTSGGVKKEGDVTIHGSISSCYVEGTGANTKL